MLICLGGFYGSGRKLMAKKLSETLGYYRYDIDAIKFHKQKIKKDGTAVERSVPQHTDGERLSLYQKVLQDFPIISKMHTDVIIDDAFHREKLREYFFSEARKYFDKVVFIWIDTDEARVEPRLRSMNRVREGSKLVRLMGLRRAQIQMYEQIPQSTPVFKCINDDDTEVQALRALIFEHLKK